MIPRTLVIKNFLSYGEQPQTIDFTPYNLICLSGKNGHGKSALLDAMTWAIWGQARKPSGATKADPNLLHLGAKHMMVTFDFDLDGTCYRVRREYSYIQGKAYAVLEFGILDPRDNSFGSLTDKTIRATQEKIEHTTRLSFEAFVNSSFLRQGNASEFSSKSPKDRKQIVATILGLGQYDAIRKRAMERSREALTRRQALEALEEKMTVQLSRSAEVDENLTATRTKIESLSKAEANCQKQIGDLEAQIQVHQTELQAAERTRIELTHSKQEENRITSELRTYVTDWRKTHKTLRQLQNKEDLEAQRTSLSKAIAQHQKILQESLQLKERMLNAQASRNQAEQRALAQHTQQLQSYQLEAHQAQNKLETQQKELTDLKAHIAAHTKQSEMLEKEIETTKVWLTDTNTKLAPYETNKALFERRKEHYQQFVAQGNSLNEKLKELQHKDALMHEQNPSCPLCEQNLSASRRMLLKKRFTTQAALVAHQFARMKGVITKLKQTLVAQHESLKVFDQLRQEQATRNAQQEARIAQYTALTKDLETAHAQQRTTTNIIDQTKKRVAQADKQVTEWQTSARTKVEQDPVYQQAHTQVIELEAHIKKHTYNQKVHEEVQATLVRVEEQLRVHERLTAETKQQAIRMQCVSELCNTIRTLRKHYVDGTAAYEKQFEALSKQHKKLETEKEVLKNQLSQLSKEKEGLLQERGSLEAQQQTLAQVKQEHAQHVKTLRELRETSIDYQTIAAATGKDGIQALLIEEAIPEIEQEANELLSKLTNNQAQIFIESLRDLKKGGTKETLDIKISDTAGIRPYELFSGGEAFRIDFALRVAISKLLARRAGATLQTLIIDEGFGSQDDEGLGLIMDAIHRIQDEFAKIIVVSHLPSMKEQFPVHFMVNKTAGSSTVQVIEQG